MRLYFACLISLIGFNAFAQMNTHDTLFNQTNSKGQKQGYWKTFYPNGHVKYQGYFKNDKPVGELKKYYEDNTPKAILDYAQDGITVRARLFYENGQRAAEGKYLGTKKDSTWNYYSYYDKTLTNKETYQNGVKQGISYKYYPTGQICEEMVWKSGLREGERKQYYQDGKMKCLTTFKNNNKTGLFRVYYDNDQIELEGSYLKDVMTGKWLKYDETGKLISTVEYVNGKASNEKELTEKEQEYFRMIEQNKGKFAEPDINDFVPDK